MKDITQAGLAEDNSAERSQFDLLTEGLRRWADAIPPEVMELKPLELEEKAEPTVLHRRLKKSFWAHYQQTISLGKKEMQPIAIYKDLCTKQYFYRYVVMDPMIFAWVLSPPPAYDIVAEEALDFGMSRIRDEILQAPLYLEKKDENGKTVRGAFIEENAKIILTAVKLLDSRVKGSPLMRVEQKNLHLHKTMDDSPKGVSKEELDRELETLRLKLSGAVPLIEAKKVDAQVVDDEDL